MLPCIRSLSQLPSPRPPHTYTHKHPHTAHPRTHTRAHARTSQTTTTQPPPLLRTGGGPGNSQKKFQDANYGPNWTYPDYAPLFTASLFDASDWVEIFESAGAQYVLPVAKHHDGFCMWNCTATAPGWNAVDTGPKRDVLTELYDAVVASPTLDFGIYFSQVERTGVRGCGGVGCGL